MLILALDTTTRAGSCALARDGVVLAERGSDPERSHAEHLPGDLIALLEGARVGLEAIDAFAVATGPGSFTGLRVGIATMQGLAFAMGKPLIGVSAFDALARLGAESSSRCAGVTAADTRLAPLPAAIPLVATWIDAWRGEVYAALYEHGVESEPPTVEHPAVILERQRERGPILFVGDGAATFAALIRTTRGEYGVVAEPPAPLLAGAVARLASAAYQSGARPSPDAIRPLYVRRTDAELARDARAGR